MLDGGSVVGLGGLGGQVGERERDVLRVIIVLEVKCKKRFKEIGAKKQYHQKKEKRVREAKRK